MNIRGNSDSPQPKGDGEHASPIEHGAVLGNDSSAPSISDVELNAAKWVLHIDRLQALARGERVFPVTVELDLVDFCNHRCDWCVDPAHGTTAMDTTTARSLLQELSALGVKGIVYKGGGEPTLHSGFAELLRATRRSGFEAGVVTNGSSLLRHAESIVAQASYVRVSVDGPTPESHRCLHGADDFDVVVEGVRRVVEFRSRRSQRHPLIGISFAVDYRFIQEIPLAVALGRTLGVDYVLFRTPFFEEVGREPTMSIMETKAVREAFEREEARQTQPPMILVDAWISDAEAVELQDSNAPSPRRGVACRHGTNGIEHVTGRCLASPLLAVVTATADVYPCCNLRGLRNWCIGRVDYERGVNFRAVWEGPVRQAVMGRIHRTECIAHCTHPLSRYNEIIEYLRGPKYHGSFV